MTTTVSIMVSASVQGQSIAVLGERSVRGVHITCGPAMPQASGAEGVGLRSEGARVAAAMIKARRRIPKLGRRTVMKKSVLMVALCAVLCGSASAVELPPRR
jgi:hypothetical protein